MSHFLLNMAADCDDLRTFNHLWAQVGNSIGKYKSYPRLVGGLLDFLCVLLLIQ